MSGRSSPTRCAHSRPSVPDVFTRGGTWRTPRPAWVLSAVTCARSKLYQRMHALPSSFGVKVHGEERARAAGSAMRRFVGGRAPPSVKSSAAACPTELPDHTSYIREGWGGSRDKQCATVVCRRGGFDQGASGSWSCVQIDEGKGRWCRDMAVFSDVTETSVWSDTTGISLGSQTPNRG